MLRKVTYTKKNLNGSIEGVGGPGWGYLSKWEIIEDIRRGVHQYEVGYPRQKVRLHVINGPYGLHLRTEADNSVENNLSRIALP